MDSFWIDWSSSDSKWHLRSAGDDEEGRSGELRAAKTFWFEGRCQSASAGDEVWRVNARDEAWRLDGFEWTREGHQRRSLPHTTPKETGRRGCPGTGNRRRGVRGPATGYFGVKRVTNVGR
jgi:hypothetical protein